MYLYVAFLALFQAPLVDDCSIPSRTIAMLTNSDAIQVRFSIAEGPEICYAVTAFLEGKPVNGYVLGSRLKALTDFERERATRIAAGVPEPVAAVAAPNNPIPQTLKPALPVFQDFSGRDLKGKPVSLSAVQGKLILVCFWSPRNEDSLREAILVTRLEGQFRRQGVKTVTVSLSSDRELMGEAQDAITVPTVLDGTDVASKYGVTFESLPRTYILNEQHEILASGLHGQQLETRVRTLATGR